MNENEFVAQCKKGDVVTFTGKKHYPSVNSNTPVSCKPDKATMLTPS